MKAVTELRGVVGVGDDVTMEAVRALHEALIAHGSCSLRVLERGAWFAVSAPDGRDYLPTPWVSDLLDAVGFEGSARLAVLHVLATVDAWRETVEAVEQLGFNAPDAPEIVRDRLPA